MRGPPSWSLDLNPGIPSPLSSPAPSSACAAVAHAAGDSCARARTPGTGEGRERPGGSRSLLDLETISASRIWSPSRELTARPDGASTLGCLVSSPQCLCRLRTIIPGRRSFTGEIRVLDFLTGRRARSTHACMSRSHRVSAAN
jgi:hypothetical protein